MRLTAAEKAEYREEALANLRDLLPPGSVVTTVSRKDTDATTRYSVLIARGDDLISLDHWVRNANVGSPDRGRGWRPGVPVGGYGMSRSFGLVYSLGRTLYPDGFPCAGKGCPANDHVNEREGNYTPGRIHSDGGYALTGRDLS